MPYRDLSQKRAKLTQIRKASNTNEKTKDLQETNLLLEENQAELEMQHEELMSQRDLANVQNEKISSQANAKNYCTRNNILHYCMMEDHRATRMEDHPVAVTTLTRPMRIIPQTINHAVHLNTMKKT